MQPQALPGAAGAHGMPSEAQLLASIEKARENFQQALGAVVPREAIVPLYAAADSWVKAVRAYTRACYPAELYGNEADTLDPP